jgi:hypothetical protein
MANYLELLSISLFFIFFDIIDFPLNLTEDIIINLRNQCLKYISFIEDFLGNLLKYRQIKYSGYRKSFISIKAYNLRDSLNLERNL